MAISASNIVSIVPRILTGTGSDLVFNGLVFTKDTNLQVNAPTSFSSASSVAEFFGDTSDEYAFASIYFGGYQNSQIKPSSLYFYRHCAEAANAFVRGLALTPSAALAELKAITVGTFNITISGNSIELANINLASCTSLSAVATVLQDVIQSEGAAVTGDDDETITKAEIPALAKATVSYSSVMKKFIISSGDTGETASITCPTGTIAAAMGFEEDSATISAGGEACTLTQTLNTLTKGFQNFVTYTTIWEADDEEAMLLAKWASSNASSGTCYMYVLWDSSKGNLDENNTTCIAEQLKAENIGATCIVYPTYEVAAFVMGAAASIAWDNTNGTMTFAFKSQDGLGASVDTDSDARALEGHSVNYIGNYATRNDNFVFFYNGSLLGSWSWIDPYLNSIWLCNALQVQIMTGFQSVRRAPYNERGYAMVRSWCRDVINRAINNGVIDKGVSLNETQKSALIEELGGDFSDEIYNSGYYLQVLDATVNSRQARTTPPCNLVYTYGGAIQRLTLPAIAVV